MYQPHTHVTVFAGLAGPDLGLRFGVDLAFCIRPVQLYTTRVPLRDVRHVSSPCATTTTTTFPPPRGVACVTIIGRTYGPTAVAGVCGVVRLRLTVYPTGGFVYPWVGYVNRKKVCCCSPQPSSVPSHVIPRPAADRSQRQLRGNQGNQLTIPHRRPTPPACIEQGC